MKIRSAGCVLDDVDWVPTGAVYEVRGGVVGEPFVLPEGFAQARSAFVERFPSARTGISSVLGDIERIATGLRTLSKGRQAFFAILWKGFWPLQGSPRW